MTRRDVFAAAAHLPWLAFELAELRRGELGMPYTRYVRKIPRWLRRVLIIATAIVAWFHFDDH